MAEFLQSENSQRWQGWKSITACLRKPWKGEVHVFKFSKKSSRVDPFLQRWEMAVTVFL